MDAIWHIELLGTLRAEHRVRLVDRFRTRKIGALLAYLALHPQRSHPREELVELFWPDSDPNAGRQSLSQALSSLRHQLEPPGISPGVLLRATYAEVHLNPAAFTTDVAEFEDAIQEARRDSNPLARERALERAVRLYRGELLPGFYDEWVLRLRERLSESYLHAIDSLLRCAEARGDITRAVDHARRGLEADPLREETHRTLMRLLVASGCPAAAQHQYKALKRILRTELGVTPDAETERLARAIESGSSDLGAPHSPSPPSHPTRRRRPAAPLPPKGTFTILAGGRGPGGGTAFPTRLREELLQHGGTEITWGGREFLFVYPTAAEALRAATLTMRAGEQPGDAEGRAGVPNARFGIDTRDLSTAAEARETATTAHAVELMLAAHPGQILCSEPTAALLLRQSHPSPRLEDLGPYRLRGERGTEGIWLLRLPEFSEVAFPPLGGAERPGAGNLPACFTRFFGHRTELEELRSAVRDPERRLITLTGAGGIGKTRLAVELCRHSSDAFPSGIWFVPLADITDPRQVPDAILSALRLRSDPAVDPLQQIARAVGGGRSLLVLDNLEHLLAGTATVVSSLLERGPQIHLLVTSRRRIGTLAEHEVPLGPLETPEGPDAPERLLEFPSVQLLVDRAQAVRPDFQVTPANAEGVAELCARLEGIPLAIELAAARASVMTPKQILLRLSRRLDFLEDRRAGEASRHRTLRATLDWSHRLLPPELQAFFAQISVFQGTWSVEAAEAVCEEPLALDLLAELREFSLLQSFERAGEVRFHLLDTIREYAAERLQARGRALLLERHARHFLERAQEARSHLASRERATWLGRLDMDRANLEAALRFCAGDKAPTDLVRVGLCLASALSEYWQLRGDFHIGRRHFEDLLARAGRRLAMERARGLQEAGFLALLVGDYAAATPGLQASLAICKRLGDQAGAAQAINHLGSVAFFQGDYVRGRALYGESLEIRRRLGDRLAIARALHNLGNVANAEGDFSRARALLEEALEIKRSFEDPWEIAGTLQGLGNVAANQKEYAAAREHYEASLAIRREVGDRQGIAHILGNLALVVSAEGDLDRSRDLHRESLAIKRDLGDRRGIASSLVNLGGLAYRRKEPESAARLLAAASSLRASSGSPLSPVEERRHNDILAGVEAALTPQAFSRLSKAGAAWTLDEAIAFALGEG